MQAAYEEFGCNDGNVFFLGIDKGNTNASVHAFDSIYGVHFPSASGQEGGGNIVHLGWEIQATPSVVVVRPDRVIAVKQIYPPSFNNLIDSITFAGGIQQSCITKVTENSETGNYSIIPNPVRNELYLSGPGEWARISIYNRAGEPVKKTLKSNRNTKITIDVRDLPGGLYFVLIETAHGDHQFEKFIKID